MRLSDAVSSFIADMRSEGRLTSDESERAYYDVLSKHVQDVGNRDPRTIGREDIKRTLARWPVPNTQANRRAILMSFYRWLVQEGFRPFNPVEQTRPPKKTEPQIYRLTTDECRRMMFVAREGREQRLIWLGICAGLRRAELRGLRGRHFRRPGFVWVSPDIGKGGKERWLPVMADIRELAIEIAETVADDEYVLCGSMAGIGGVDGQPIARSYEDRPMGQTTIYKMVVAVGKRAGIAASINPHLLRHAFCDHVARLFGLEIAQELMGHSDPKTTAGYTGRPTLEQLSELMTSATFGAPSGATPLHGTPISQLYRQRDLNPRAQPAVEDRQREPNTDIGGRP